MDRHSDHQGRVTGQSQISFVERFLAEDPKFGCTHRTQKFKNCFIFDLTNNPPAKVLKPFCVNLFEFMNQVDCPVFVEVEHFPVAIDRRKEHGC